MLAVMGTSTCHIMNGERARRGARHVRRRRRAGSRRACGATRPGRAASATSSAGSPTTPSRRATTRRRARKGIDLHDHLSQLAGEQEVGAHGLLALDWNNGNRSVLVDHELSGLIVGLTLGTRAEDVYRALIEATAFGTRKIIETFEASGLPVRRADRRRRAAQEPGDHADLRRRHAALAAPHRLRAGPRAGLGDARGGRRRRVPRHLRRGRRDGQASAATSTRPTRRAPAPTTRSTSTTRRLHDHFGRGGDDVMHALRHIRPREVARG